MCIKNGLKIFIFHQTLWAAMGPLAFLFSLESSWAYATPLNGYSITFSQENFASAPQYEAQSSQYTTLMPSASFFRKWGRGVEQTFAGDALAILPVSSEGMSTAAAAVPELYFRQDLNQSTFSWTVGRQKNNWSELDSYWGSGLWQPSVRWDASQPIEQGLTGLFVEFKQNNLRSIVMISGLFIPDQQPQFQKEDGQLISTNRWFRGPAPAVGFDEEYHTIRYDIENPDSSKVVFQNSVVAQFSWGDSAWNPNQVGPFIKFAFTDKPANQLTLEVSPQYDFPTKEAKVTVYPQVIQHNLFTIESGFQWEYTRLVASTTSERFDKPNSSERIDGPTATLRYQTPIVDARYDGLILSQSLDPIGVHKAVLDMSYVNRTEKSNNSSGFIKGDAEASSQRFLFEQMVSLRFKKTIFKNARNDLGFHTQYTYSVNDEGEWIQAGVNYSMDRQWNFALAGDLFGVPSDTSSGTSFISKYRGNDRITGSLTYVF